MTGDLLLECLHALHIEEALILGIQGECLASANVRNLWHLFQVGLLYLKVKLVLELLQACIGCLLKVHLQVHIVKCVSQLREFSGYVLLVLGDFDLASAFLEIAAIDLGVSECLLQAFIVILAKVLPKRLLQRTSLKFGLLLLKISWLIYSL